MSVASPLSFVTRSAAIAQPRDGLGPHREHTKADPCPVCGKARCISFNDGGVICLRVPSDHPVRTGWYHDTEPPDGTLHVVPAEPQPHTDPLPPDQLNAVYRHLLSLLPLDGGLSFDDEHIGFRRPTPHRDELHRRGMTDAQIAARGIGSYPSVGRPELAKTLIDAFGEPIIGHVPGLHLGREGNVADRYATLAGPAGMLISVTDVEGRVIGLQIKRDKPTADGGKYQPLSSNPARGYVGGCGSGSPLHVARPLGPRPEPNPAPSWPLGVPGVSEGVIKSNVASDRLGETILGLPGIGGYRDVVPTLQRLGADRAVIALDRDQSPNTAAAVQQAENTIARTMMLAGITPLLATWDPAAIPDQWVKGADDALAAGVEIDVMPFPKERIKIRSGDIVETDPLPTRPRPLRTIDEARAILARRLREAMERPEPGHLQVSAGTGVGKTRAIADVLTTWHRDGWPHKTVRRRSLPIAEPIRVLITAPTKELCAEVFGLLPPGLAMLQEGRNPDANHAWGCLEPERIGLAGAGRHNPHADVCSECSLIRGWQRGFPECGYLRSKALADTARIVVAPADSYFNGSTELRKFDIVVADEALLPYLLEQIDIDRARIDEWRERMNRIDAERPIIIDHEGNEFTGACYPLDSPFRRFVDALDMMLAHSPGSGHRWTRALPELIDVCPDLDDVVAAILTVEPAEESGRYACETPELWVTDARMLVPLRAIHDLAEAIATERSRDDQADTRLWLTPDGLRFLQPRQHVIDLLRTRTIINTDATPHPALRFFLSAPEVISVDAPIHQHVTQTTDLLGTAKELAGVGNANVSRLKTALEAVTADAEQPVIFSRKRFAPDGTDGDGSTLAVSNPGAQYGWFDNQTRGLNRFQAVDVLVVVGRYSHPIDRLRAEVMAARFSPDPAPDGERLELLRFDWQDATGRGKGRWTRADADLDVNAAIRWSESSSILQAIGRGRGVNRPADDPLRVYVVSNLPIDGLVIDRLTTLEELGAEPPRRGATPPEFYDARDERNAAAEAANRARVVDALSALQSEGARITYAEVSRRSGVSRVSLTKNATLKALVQQAQQHVSAVRCEPVNPWTDNDISLSLQGFTDPRPNTQQQSNPAPTVLTPPPPPHRDMAPAREALTAADSARSREDLHQATAELAASLVGIARARGRASAPKPGDIPLKELRP